VNKYHVFYGQRVTGSDIDMGFTVPAYGMNGYQQSFEGLVEAYRFILNGSWDWWQVAMVTDAGNLQLVEGHSR
jgi:hypothetical protein